MLLKIFIVFVGSAVLLGSAAVGWGTVFRVVSKSEQPPAAFELATSPQRPAN